MPIGLESAFWNIDLTDQSCQLISPHGEHLEFAQQIARFVREPHRVADEHDGARQPNAHEHDDPDHF